MFLRTVSTRAPFPTSRESTSIPILFVVFYFVDRRLREMAVAPRPDEQPAGKQGIFAKDKPRS